LKLDALYPGARQTTGLRIQKQGEEVIGPDLGFEMCAGRSGSSRACGEFRHLGLRHAFPLVVSDQAEIVRA
jgi:hypothetical protein